MKSAFLIATIVAATFFLEADEGKRPQAEVLFFIATDCPVANYYAPEINRIFSEYEAQGIVFSLIYPNTDLTEEEVATHRRDYDLKIEGRIDKDHILVKKSGATTTPEVAVFNADGKLIYRGMIDDLYTELGDRRRVASQRYLRDVLALCLEQKGVVFSETKPIGCLIESIK